MLAAHDQENLVSIYQAASSNKQQGTTRGLQPKTPGARYPKTPLKVPLNDENAVRGLGGKSILANNARADKSQWVTPAGERAFLFLPLHPRQHTKNPTHHTYVASMSAYQNHTEPRTGRAVLGDKTTNAKARKNQTTDGKNTAARDAEKSQARPTTVSRPRPHALKAESSKLHILLDQLDPLSDEVDTNPSPPPGLPYESDVFPAGILTFDAIRPENRMKGYYDYYHNRRDENGMTRVDREMKAAQELRFRDADVQIRKDLDEFEWDLGLDSPKKKIVPLQEPAEKRVIRPGAGTKAPSTLTSRRAASALGMASKPSITNLQRKPLSAKPNLASNAHRLPSFMQPTKAKQHATSTTNNLTTRPRIPSAAINSAAVAASRSTLGYNKGRSASSVVQSHARSRPEAPTRARALARSDTAASDRTVTPASYARDATVARPEFVSIFDVPPEEEEDRVAEAEVESDDQLFGPVGCDDDNDDDDGGMLAADEILDLLPMSEEGDFRFELDL